MLQTRNKRPGPGLPRTPRMQWCQRSSPGAGGGGGRRGRGRRRARVLRTLALRSGSGPGCALLRAASLLAPLWLLAPTLGSHMTPAPLALRASRGWRGK